MPVILEEQNGTTLISHDVASTRTVLPNALVQRIVVLKSAKRNLPLKERELFHTSMIKLIILYDNTQFGTQFK